MAAAGAAAAACNLPAGGGGGAELQDALAQCTGRQRQQSQVQRARDAPQAGGRALCSVAHITLSQPLAGRPACSQQQQSQEEFGWPGRLAPGADTPRLLAMNIPCPPHASQPAMGGSGGSPNFRGVGLEPRALTSERASPPTPTRVSMGGRTSRTQGGAVLDPAQRCGGCWELWLDMLSSLLTQCEERLYEHELAVEADDMRAVLRVSRFLGQYAEACAAVKLAQELEALGEAAQAAVLYQEYMEQHAAAAAAAQQQRGPRRSQGQVECSAALDRCSAALRQLRGTHELMRNLLPAHRARAMASVGGWWDKLQR